MAANQMNVRIDSSLKAAGNLALGENDITPSDLVRSVWEYLARNRHAPAAIRRLVDFLQESPDGGGGPTGIVASGASLDAAVADDDEIVMRGPLLVQKFYDDFGIDAASIEPMTYDELKELAYAEKYSSLDAAKAGGRP